MYVVGVVAFRRHQLGVVARTTFLHRLGGTADGSFAHLGIFVVTKPP